MQARDVMTREPVTATPQTPVAVVMDTLLERDVRHLPIVEGDELVGMISDRDVRQFSRDMIGDATRAQAKLRMPISKLMTADVLAVDVETNVDDIIDTMIENKVGAVPVVDGDGVLVGIVSYVDILRAAAGRL